MINEKLLPWHQKNWQLIHDQIQHHRLPHAFLCSGSLGIGKELFVQHWAKSLLCQFHQVNGMACDQCRSCHWFDVNTHPDYLGIVPQEGKMIKIEQIKELIYFHSRTASVNQSKVIVIKEAHLMNPSAANALLKTLEEPVSNTFIILMTEYPMKLPETIRSRCQKLVFSTPTQKEGIDWVKQQVQLNHQNDQALSILFALCLNAPLKVLEWIDQKEMIFRKNVFESWIKFLRGSSDIVQLSESWKNFAWDRLIGHWQSWMEDLLILKQKDCEKFVRNQDFIDDLQEIALKYTSQTIDQIWQESYRLHNAVRMGLHLNNRLMIESLLIRWLQ